MFERAFTLAVLTFLLVAAGCSSSPSVLITIGSEKIPLKDFEWMYAQNNGGWAKAETSTVADRKRFLDLFVKYRLKLHEAQAQGLLQDSSIQNEIQSYRSTIASSYMMGKELIEPRLQEMYRRSLEEIRASHILIRLQPNASPVDTLVAYTNAEQLLKTLATASFDSVARQYSQDPSARTNNGDLGWFSQGRMVKEFEDAAYALRPGEVSPRPVRSRFGYHIIKVVARQPNKGSVRVSHVLRRFAPDLSDTAIVRDSVNFILKRLYSAEITFAQAAYLYSDDPASKMRGGDLGFYERTGLPEDIASIFFTTRVNTIAPPYRAPYGYHIFTVTDVKPVPTFEEAESSLRQQYQQLYYTTDVENYMHSLVSRYHLDFDVSLRYQVSHAFDSTKTALDSSWSDTIPKDWLPRTLFSFDAKKFTVKDLLAKLKDSPEFSSTLLSASHVEDIIDRISRSSVLEYHTSTIAERFPEFETLMKEYENGTLIYRIEQDEIYDKIPMADSLLHDYYSAHRRNFRWPMRVNLGEIHVKSESLAVNLYDRIQKGEDFESLAAQYTERPGFKEKRGVYGLIPLSSNGLTEIAVSMKTDSVTHPFQYESGWSIIKKLGRKLVEDKSFEEALPEVTTQYRENATRIREEQWLESLKAKYGVSVEEELLGEAFKRKQNE